MRDNAMGEKIVRAFLGAIPTILLIMCIVAAFATHSWDVQATLLAESPQKTIERLLSFESSAESGLLEDIEFEVSEDRTELTFEAVIHSPLKVPVTIKEMSAELSLYGSTVIINLPSEVDIPAGGSTRLKLEGSLAEVKMPTQLPEEMPTPDIRNMKMKLDIGGIELEMGESGMGGVI